MNNVSKLVLSAVLAVGVVAAPMVEAAVPADKKELVKQLKKKRGGKALGPRIGKKVQAAFELYSADDVNGALEILLELEPKNEFDQAYVHRFIGNMYAGQKGQVDKALDSLFKAKELDQLPFDDHAGVIKLIADLSLQEQKFEQAIKHYYEYIEFSYDQDPNVYLRLANSYYEMKKYPEVIEPAKKAIELFPKPNQNPYVLIMASYYERKMYPEATKALETLVKVFPENPKWWTQLGMFYMLIEDYQRGLSTMEVAYKQGYLSTKAQYKQLAQLYASNGIPFKAATILEKYTESGVIDKDRSGVAIMATTFQNAREYKKAAKYFGEAAKIGKVDGDLLRKQGNALMIVEDFSGAVKAYQDALDAGVKREGLVYMALAEAEFYRENWKKAHVAIKKAMEDKSTAKSARGWESYIRDTAERKGVAL